MHTPQLPHYARQGAGAAPLPRDLADRRGGHPPRSRRPLADLLRREVTALRANPRELANSITHGIGLALSLAGAVFLVIAASAQGTFAQILGCTIYAAALVAVYAASTLSHAVQDERLNRLFRILDQGFIYLLIAGTYTPFGLTYLSHGGWWALTVAMWTVALWGCYLKLVRAHRIESVSIATCVLLGWMPIISLPSMIGLIPQAAMIWVTLGGVFYTAGTLFLAWDGKAAYFHAVWHVAVIAGSVCHYVAILFYVVPWQA